MTEIIHLIGIGGAGMSGLARILARQGQAVTGSDMRESPALESLRAEFGIRAIAGHDAANVDGATLVVVSAAVKDDNPEIVAARERGIPVISRAAMLGRLMSHYSRSIAISGTHGKTTTTGMTATVLDIAGLDPTVLIGGDMAAYGGNARLGGSDVFVAEACEAYDSFLDLHPWISVITNIEADHLDYYADFDAILRSFRQFLGQTSGKVIACGEDLGVYALYAHADGLPPLVTYGVEEASPADQTLYGVAMRSEPPSGLAVNAVDVILHGLCPSYTAVHDGVALGRITLGVPGVHNVLNSLAAVAVGIELGVPFEKIAEGLAAFTGTGRRFERLGVTAGGVTVVDDYAHHPTEIRATLAAARKAFGSRRIIAVFQPHLPSRTRDFKDDFAASFADADHVVLTDIYLAREKPLAGVTGESLAALTAERRGADVVDYVSDKRGIPARLGQLTGVGDVVITLGAGDIREVAEAFLGRGVVDVVDIVDTSGCHAYSSA